MNELLVYIHDGTDIPSDFFTIELDDSRFRARETIPIVVGLVSDETPRVTVNRGLHVRAGQSYKHICGIDGANYMVGTFKLYLIDVAFNAGCCVCLCFWSTFCCALVEFMKAVVFEERKAYYHIRGMDGS